MTIIRVLCIPLDIYTFNLFFLGEAILIARMTAPNTTLEVVLPLGDEFDATTSQSATTTPLLSKLAEIKKKYGPSIAARRQQEVSQKEEEESYQRLHRSREAVQALLSQTTGSHASHADDSGGIVHRRGVNGTARDHIEAMLVNRAKANVAAALDASFERCEASLTLSPVAAPSPLRRAAVAAPPMSSSLRHNPSATLTLIQSLRSRREAAEAAAHTTMADITAILEASHVEEAHGLLHSSSDSFGRKAAVAIKTTSAYNEAAFSSGVMIGDDAAMTTPSEARGVVEAVRTRHIVTANSIVTAPGGGSTPLRVIATVPHFLQHGLFFTSLQAVTHSSPSASSLTHNDIVAEPPAQANQRFVVAHTVEELMCFTARQLALRILFAVWQDIVQPMGAKLSSYERNFSLSQVSTAAVRAALYRWGAVTSSSEPSLALPCGDHDGDAPTNMVQGFEVVAEMYDAGILQVVVSRSSLIVGEQSEPPLQRGHDTLVSPEQSRGNVTDAAAPSAGFMLRHETPLSGTNTFRRWVTFARATFRQLENELRFGVPTSTTASTFASSSVEPSAVAAVPLPTVQCYVFEMRPGTMDSLHFHQQFSELG